MNELRIPVNSAKKKDVRCKVSENDYFCWKKRELQTSLATLFSVIFDSCDVIQTHYEYGILKLLIFFVSTIFAR